VVNLRGRIVPAVDVRTCLGLEQSVVTSRSRLIVVEIAGRYFALLVDRVARILKLPSSQVRPPDSGRYDCLAGMATVVGATIHIIDTEQMLLASPDMRPSTGKE